MADGKEQLEQLAKNSIGIRLILQELLTPFELCNDLKIHRDLIGRIYYCLNNSTDCNRCPKELVNGKYRKIFALYENSELKIYGPKKS